jgi:hypothetical protein
VSGQVHAPAALPPGERALGTHWIGGWVDPEGGLDYLEKRKFLILPELELLPLSRQAHRHALYRLRYASSYSSS